MNTFRSFNYTKNSISIFFLLLFLMAIVFGNRMLPALWIVTAILQVFVFFFYANKLTIKWREIRDAVFRKKLFWTAFAIRSVYVIVSYFFYKSMTGIPFEFEAADSQGYHQEAIWLSHMITNLNITPYLQYVGTNISDLGYPFYLSIIYTIFGDSIIVARLFKALWGALTCLLVYKFTKRNFGETAAKVAGIITMLFPSMIYYCGLHVKEIEMTFLVVLFIERADFFIKSNKTKVKELAIVLLVALTLFLFRTVLGVVAFFSLISVVMFSKKKVVNFNRKLMVLVWIVIIGFVVIGTPLEQEILKYWNARDSNLESAMIANSLSQHGNNFAEFAQTSLFLPIVAIAPFPTLVNIPWQQNHMFFAGGYYVKNIIAFFVLLALMLIIKRNAVFDNMLLLSFIFAYLGILAMSKFALVERFHLPIYPLTIVLASYGITSEHNKLKRFFPLYLVLISLIILAWNWLKLAGRGLA